MLNQSSDLPAGYQRLLRHLRNKRWLAGSPLAGLQQLWFPRHRVGDDRGFFPALIEMSCRRVPERPLEQYRDELCSDAALRAAYEAAGRAGRPTVSLDQHARKRIANVAVFYALVRELRPRLVVETGTASGLMTSWMLAALERNGDGRLISIDLPPRQGELTMEMTLAADAVGYFVPDEYRGRWTLIPGDAKVHLPAVLAEHAADLFVHDSLHTRTHMLFELNVARTLMRPGTCIVADDILWNDAFFSFVASHRLRSLGCISNPNIGITRNDFDAYEHQVGVAAVRAPG